MMVDFYYSIGSRYSYLASTQIAALEKETSCRVAWYPVNSVRLIDQCGVSPFKGEPVSGQYEWSYRELDANRWAELYGVPYVEPRGRVRFDSELLARACIAAKRLGKVVEFSHLLFSAMFQDLLSEIDERECTVRASACGIEATEFRTVLAAPETLSQLDTTIDRAYRTGVFGVPTFITSSGELFWGNDRIVLLRHYLRSHSRNT